MDRIRQWFADHEDGEFSVPPKAHPFWVIPPAPESRSIVYTTKPRAVLPLFSAVGGDVPCGLIGRYGLPLDDHVDWLRSLAKGRPYQFLGDADPSDLSWKH